MNHRGRYYAIHLLFVLFCTVAYSEEFFVPVVLEQTPAPGSVVSTQTPMIQIKFEDPQHQILRENILMEVAGSDVSALAQFADQTLTYYPPAEVPGGLVEVRISGTAVNGQKLQEIQWNFTVVSQDQPRSWQFGLQPTATYEYGLHREGEAINQDRFTSNIGINSQNTGAVQTTINSNLQGQSTAVEPMNQFDLGNFQAVIASGSRSLALGDVVVNYDLLGVSNLARRGIYFQQQLPFLSSGFDIFSVRSESIIGFRHGLGISDGNQRVNGGSFFFAPAGRPESMLFRFYYLMGENAAEEGFNFGGVTRGSKGDAFGIGLAGGVFTNQLRYEAYVSRSNFDFNASDGFQGNRDYGFQGKVTYDPPGGTWMGKPSKFLAQVELQNLGLFYKSLGNPFLVSDRSGVTINSTWSWGIYGLTGGIAKFHDNVKELDVLPTVNNIAYSAVLNVTPLSQTGPPAWPSLSFTAARAEQESRGEAVSFLALHNIVDTYGANAQFTRPQWSASLSTNYTINDDASGRGPDSDAKSINLSSIFTPSPAWNMGPAISFTRQVDRGTDIHTDLWTYSWTSAFPIRPEKMDVATQLTYAVTESSDEQNKGSNLGGTLQLNLHLQPFFKTPGKQSLGLRVSYNRVVVDAPFFNLNKGLEVFVLLDLGWPFQWQ